MKKKATKKQPGPKKDLKRYQLKNGGHFTGETLESMNIKQSLRGWGVWVTLKDGTEDFLDHSVKVWANQAEEMMNQVQREIDGTPHPKGFKRQGV